LLQTLAPWEEPALQRELHRLVEAELLYQRGLPPQATYLFKHALIRDAAYESLLKRTRQQYHRQIADALEEQFPEITTAQPELLAYHFSRSEAWDHAFTYLVRSGGKARQVYANQEAITFYTQAVEASGRITPALDAAQLLPLYEGRGLVWMLLTRYEAAIADFQMMCQTARASGDQHQEGESLCHLALAHWSTFAAEHLPFVEQYADEAFQLAQRTGDQKILARSLASLGSIDMWRGHLQEAEQKLNASLQISRREGYPDVLSPGLMWRGAQAYWQGDFQRAVQFCREGVPVSRAIYDGFLELMTLAFLCLAHWSAGDYTQAFAVAHEGMTKAQERENTFILGRLTNTLGWFYHEFGDLSRALAYDQESVELGRVPDISNVEISALINVGLDHLALGQYEQARSYLEPTLERVEREASGAHRWRWKIRLLTGLANLAYATGAYEQALHYGKEGLREAQATSSQKYVALNRALRGKIAAQLGNAETAGTELQRAFALAETLQSPSLIYPIAYDLGHWYESIGKAREARTLYGKAWAMIEQMVQAVEDTALRDTLLQSALVQTISERVTRRGGSSIT
jgi:tetratricopeptide (TPR) repeat protein